MRIALVATGGTIASRPSPDGLVADVPGAELLASVDLDRLPAGVRFTVVDVGTRGSYALRLDDMRAIADAALEICASGADGVVVTHGTDSIEETAFLIDLLHEGEAPIVVTGAQRAFGVPDGDGPDNLALAISTATSAQLRGRGVLVAFGERVLPAPGVRKVETEDLAAFANPSHPSVDDVRRSTLPGAAVRTARRGMPPVAVVATVPGGDGTAVRDALQHRPAGLVVQALGIGNTSGADAAAVAETVAAGVPVLVTSRVLHGPVRPRYKGGIELERAGAVFAGDLTTWQARVLLSVCLALEPGTAAGRTVEAWVAEHAPA